MVGAHYVCGRGLTELTVTRLSPTKSALPRTLVSFHGEPDFIGRTPLARRYYKCSATLKLRFFYPTTHKYLASEQQLTHFETHWEQRQFPLILACDDWHDPLNVGAAFRLADAFGLEAIWLGGTSPLPPNRKIKKTSRSTHQWVPYLHHSDLVLALQNARKMGYYLVGVEITSASMALDEYCRAGLDRPTVLVLGAENRGIQERVLAVLDQCVHIPMYGRGSSLNVATALAIGLYAWTAAWRPQGSQ